MGTGFQEGPFDDGRRTWMSLGAEDRRGWIPQTLLQPTIRYSHPALKIT